MRYFSIPLFIIFLIMSGCSQPQFDDSYLPRVDIRNYSWSEKGEKAMVAGEVVNNGDKVIYETLIQYKGIKDNQNGLFSTTLLLASPVIDTVFYFEEKILPKEKAEYQFYFEKNPDIARMIPTRIKGVKIK